MRSMNLEELRKAIVSADADVARTLTEKALKVGVPVSDILNKGLILGLHEVGNMFEDGSYFLPELICSGDAAAVALEILEPVLRKEDAPRVGKYVIGTVERDIHDLGKNIVIMMLRGNGWEVTDLGVDVSPEEFCSAVAKGDYQILGMSALLTTTMPNVAKTIDALRVSGLRDRVKVMVGGAPTTAEWATRIGADGHAKDAVIAVRVAKELVGWSSQSRE